MSSAFPIHTFDTKKLDLPVVNMYTLSKQRGISTILMVLLISLAMTVSSLGVVYTIRGGQALQVAAHASTHSQASALAGVEAFRLYLLSLKDNLEELEKLSGNLAISIDNVSASLSAQNVKVTPPKNSASDSHYQVTANIRAQDTAAQSSSIIQVVYRVYTNLCSGTTELERSVDFQRDLSLGGEIIINDPTGDQSALYVDGDVNFGGIDITGVEKITATGDVSIGSAVFVPEVWSNKNLSLTGGANVGKASALGTITTDGGAFVDIAYANGNIILGGAASGDIHSRANIVYNTSSASMSLTAGGEISINNDGERGDIRAVENIEISHSEAAAGIVQSGGNITCPVGWDKYDSMEAKGTVSCEGTDSENINSNAEQVDIAIMGELLPFSMAPTRVDAWALRSQANYLFTVEDGKKKVTVSNINGVSDGDYFLGTYKPASNLLQDYLCTEVNSSGHCTTAPVATICKGFSQTNACFSYSGDTWTINGTSIAPGVAWFEGSLMLASGNYSNTFVASKNISTAGNHKTEAINFAGYANVCTDSSYKTISTPSSILFPANLCNLSDAKLQDNKIGNIALLAGGYNPSNSGSYEGGDVDLGALTQVGGSVLAGNYFQAAADVTVNGYVSASGLGAAVAEKSNQLGASFTVDLEALPETFQPGLIPDMSSDAASCTADPSNIARTFWSRYL